MQTLIFACSERENNFTRRASEAVSRFLPEPEIIELKDFHLNIFGTADEDTRQKLQVIKEKFMQAQQIIFVSPEYNWGLSPNAKNLIDYLSGDSGIWSDKVFMAFGCSIGRGGRLPIIELWKTLNKIIALSNSISIVSPFHIEITSNLLTSENDFTDEFKPIAKAVFENHSKVAERFLA
ncbi:MAG: NAD(P)H-dependent oxidoreductase [Candidatus Caenarcaniphilales bacterium]|nr:NAD(P)H-dependent oxidoreductase [Candidatus Caenarcaniphilales bacterium]